MSNHYENTINWRLTIFCYEERIAQPLTSRPANPEVRGSSPTRGLGLSRSQRLGTGLLLVDREVML